MQSEGLEPPASLIRHVLRHNKKPRRLSSCKPVDRQAAMTAYLLVQPEGLEPPTPWFAASFDTA